MGSVDAAPIRSTPADAVGKQHPDAISLKTSTWSFGVAFVSSTAVAWAYRVAHILRDGIHWLYLKGEWAIEGWKRADMLHRGKRTGQERPVLLGLRISGGGKVWLWIRRFLRMRRHRPGGRQKAARGPMPLHDRKALGFSPEQMTCVVYYFHFV